MAHSQQIAALPRLYPAQGLLRSLVRMIAIGKTRRDLGRLEAHHLADIGLNRAAATAEAAKPFWRG